jgi:molybdate transport system substrate-binding protein
MLKIIASILTMSISLAASAHAETVTVYAAGSLKTAMTDIARTFEAKTPGVTVVPEFGASGLLRERIEKGEAAHVFASADMGHPQKLVDLGKATGPVTVMTRNALCVLARSGIVATTDTVLATLLDPKVKLGISTPKVDPSGDYAFALFAKAEAVTPGSKPTLEGKAVQLTGGPSSPKAPEGRNLYAWVIDSGQADVFLTYCTNAKLAQAEIASLQIVELPQALSVGAYYGMVVLNGAVTDASVFAAFVAGSEGQAILAKYGFSR